MSQSLSVIASAAKQSRGRSTTVWAAGGAAMLWPLDCFVARAPRNDGWGAADPIDSVVVGGRLGMGPLTPVRRTASWSP
jgi:hypothetical protein